MISFCDLCYKLIAIRNWDFVHLSYFNILSLLSLKLIILYRKQHYSVYFKGVRFIECSYEGRGANNERKMQVYRYSSHQDAKATSKMRTTADCQSEFKVIHNITTKLIFITFILILFLIVHLSMH